MNRSRRWKIRKLIRRHIRTDRGFDNIHGRSDRNRNLRRDTPQLELNIAGRCPSQIDVDVALLGLRKSLLSLRRYHVFAWRQIEDRVTAIGSCCGRLRLDEIRASGRNGNVRHRGSALIRNDARYGAGRNALGQGAGYKKSKDHERQNQPQNSIHGFVLSGKLNENFKHRSPRCTRAARNRT